MVVYYLSLMLVPELDFGFDPQFGIVPEDVHVDFVIDIPLVFLSFGDRRNHLEPWL